MPEQVQGYKARLEIERLNDGKYLIQVQLSGSTQRLSYDTREDFFAALDSFKQELTDLEAKIDGETPVE